MHAPQSLARRIVVAFVLMTAAVAGLFSVAVVSVVNSLEIDLVSDSMNRHLDFLIADESRGSRPQAGPGLALYVVPADDSSALPSWLAVLGPGLHEEVNEGEAYHILVRELGTRRYLLVLDQDDFERREAALFSIVSVGFVLCILAAWLLGTTVARTVISPVVRLSGQVQHRDQLLPLAPPLAADYADDEVGALAAAFDHALDQLREALDRERLFTSDVSHELRTPLMIIASSCELMREHDPGGDERRMQQIDRIARACAEMQELVETFFRLARPKDDRNAAMVATSLASAADEQLRRWQPEAAQRGLELNAVTESPDGGVYPAPLLRAVMSNLLRNAIYYTDHGFVRLILRNGGFSLIDSGTGIPAEERERVFQPFARGDAGRGDGIGIGLSLVQRICARLGWTVRLGERAGGGCEFRVDFRAP